MAILQELDRKYSISERTILVGSVFTDETINFYSQLRDYVEKKSRELVQTEKAQDKFNYGDAKSGGEPI